MPVCWDSLNCDADNAPMVMRIPVQSISERLQGLMISCWLQLCESTRERGCRGGSQAGAGEGSLSCLYRLHGIEHLSSPGQDRLSRRSQKRSCAIVQAQSWEGKRLPCLLTTPHCVATKPAHTIMEHHNLCRRLTSRPQIWSLAPDILHAWTGTPQGRKQGVAEPQGDSLWVSGGSRGK